MQRRATHVLVVYAALVVAFALAHYSIASEYSRRLTPIDALYFSVTTISSVGFGDIVPTSTRAKVLTMLEQAVAISAIANLLLARAAVADARHVAPAPRPRQ